MVSQCTKYEVSRFTRYEAMNGGAKCRKWGGRGHSRPWAMSPFVRAHTTSYSTLIETMCLSFTSAGVDPVEFRGDLWRPKNTFSGLLCGVVCVILCLTVLVELRLVTDTETGPWLVPRMHSIVR